MTTLKLFKYGFNMIVDMIVARLKTMSMIGAIFIFEFIRLTNI